MNPTDRHWERYGKVDPYFGVLSQSKYKRSALNQPALQEFFATGEDYVQRTLDEIERHVAKGFKPRKVMDFGSGVGRLLIPFARRSESVHGVDVSASMRAEASENLRKVGLTNVILFESDDELSTVGSGYDLINSHFVLQHVSTSRGLKIIAQLLRRLGPGGVIVLGLPYASDGSAIRLVLSRLRRYVPAANALANLVERNPINYPHMEMNVYPLPDLFRLFDSAGMNGLWLDLGSDGFYRTAKLIAQKDK